MKKILSLCFFILGPALGADNLDERRSRFFVDSFGGFTITTVCLSKAISDRPIFEFVYGSGALPNIQFTVTNPNEDGRWYFYSIRSRNSVQENVQQKLFVNILLKTNDGSDVTEAYNLENVVLELKNKSLVNKNSDKQSSCERSTLMETGKLNI